MVAFGNVLIVAIFGTLAWLFKKWWIVLFTGFFMMSQKAVTKDKNDEGDEND